jgi:arylformamidase
MSSPIFRGYDRAGLDAQYNNRAKVSDYETHVARWTTAAQIARDTLSPQLDVPYSSGPDETLNIFPARSTSAAPVLVYIHGGYWMARSKADTDGIALGLVPKGITLVNVDYSLMPGARMDDLVRQCRAAVAWTLTHAASFGGDPSSVWIAGHSAGGHLTASVAATDWSAYPMASQGRVPAGGFAFSGLYDLEPIRLSYLNEVLLMDSAEAQRNAPIGMTAPARGDWTLLVGGNEGPEYLRQSFDLGSAWGTNEKRRVQVEVVEGADHFSIVAPLYDQSSALIRRMVSTIG